MGRMKTHAERERKGMKPKYVMANLVYGNMYASLFLENQVKSLIDPTNLPALRERYDIEYFIFTDDQTNQSMSRHPYYIQMSQVLPITTVRIVWPPDADQFASRYRVLVDIFHAALKVALEKEAWLSVWVADLVFAKHSLPKMLRRLDAGHDAVFNVPIRSAADAVNPLLQKLTGAPSDMELFEMAYRNLHHLWVHSQWQTELPMFSRMPYSMLWNSGTGLVAHNFGITPIVFKPNEAMRELRGGIDGDLPGFFKNPFWATDWTDAAVAGVEPLSNGHYPPFAMEPASVTGVSRWAAHGGPENGPAVFLPLQAENLAHPLYYPSRARFNDNELASRAAEIAGSIRAQLLRKE